MPYFEFIRSGSNVTGINWRIVKASDTSTAVAQDFGMRLNTFEVWNYDEDKIHNGRPRADINANEAGQGTYTFDEPIAEADIYRVRIRLKAYDEATEKIYSWNFYVAEQPELYLWPYHASETSLVNGKSDYSNAKFSYVAFLIENKNPAICEEKHFTDAGRVTIPGGGYTLKNFETGETLNTVAGDTTFKLKFDDEGAIGDEYIEYWPVDDSGTDLVFAGGAETGLNGKNITWTLPAELNLNGNGVIPTHKTTAAQLETGVPYIELVSADGYITAVNYKIVKSSDTSTAITPSYDTDFRIYLDRATGRDVWANTYRSSWLRKTASGTYTLDIPQPVDNVKRMRVRLRSYEDASSPAVHQWSFYPAAADTEESLSNDNNTNPGSSSGGCNAGVTLFSLAALAILKKKS